ncbi:hypothetical protein F4802DRAFT_596206 [Xylaria palmicola]|nr:hypothetical protein F4802DRAFT_596206 [Xylaria palmicola]
MEIDPAILAQFGPPPPGLDLTEKQDTAIISVALLSTVFATIASALRLWAKKLQRSSMKADDYLMIVGLIFTYGTLVITILGAKAGAGRHVWAQHPQQIADIFRLLYSYTFIYAGSVSFTKLSILLFYRSLFKRGSKWFHIRLAFAAFFSLGYLFSIWGAAAALCQPTEYFWTRFLKAKGKCININGSFLSLTVLNLVADLLVLIVPIPEILGLQMSTKKKLGVCGVMLLGGLVCVVSAVRIWAFYRFTVAIDITWVQANVFLLSSVEPSFGIVSACLPTLGPLYLRVLEKITERNTEGGSNGKSGYTISKSSRIGNSYVRFGTDSSKSVGRDDIALTSIAKGPSANQLIPQNIIMLVPQEPNHLCPAARYGKPYEPKKIAEDSPYPSTPANNALNNVVRPPIILNPLQQVLIRLFATQPRNPSPSTTGKYDKTSPTTSRR